MDNSAVLLLVAAVTLAALALAGCGQGSTGDDRVPERSAGETATTDQGVVQEAVAFGGLAVPTDAEVLGVQHQSGIDDMYVLAFATPPDSIEAMLTGSGFSTALTPGREVHQRPVDGLEFGTGDEIASGQDVLAPGEGRTQRVNRKVLVDRADPDRPVVHWWLFTT
ncbi:hypothetical protein [Amycolatopsis aidingensis]|uniref:hypothetical protein n=1 Tax=Amycolatopsis aidingensis TaxID=2842453 RepID=UPI001C0BB2AA|nr:hypothetical protein [Amycolatopsis aidingensis]